MGTDQLIYFAAALVVIVIAAYIINKVASCLIKTMVFILLLASICVGYYLLIS